MGGYFYNVADGSKYYGSDIGLTVDAYATAFPDIHRELDSFYFDDNVTDIVEIHALNGTHKGDLATATGIVSCYRKRNPRAVLRRFPYRKREGRFVPLLPGGHHYSEAARTGLNRRNFVVPSARRATGRDFSTTKYNSRAFRQTETGLAKLNGNELRQLTTTAVIDSRSADWRLALRRDRDRRGRLPPTHSQ